MKAISLKEAESFDLEAYDNKLRKESEKRISSTIKEINSIIPPLLNDIKKGGTSVVRDFDCADMREWDVVKAAFAIEGFKVSFYPPHKMLSISLQ